jgi:transcriptional antiterminator NusG|tara:strand:- start:14264 stop:14794 length:531 start_codon:yes stop_codon:yes gene_type:complete
MNWYSLRVMSGKEEKIKSSIFRELEYEPDIAKSIEDILIPTENVVHIKNGKKLVKKKVFFPGYILLNMTMNIQTKFFIENIDGVMSFVGPKASPQSLNDDEIKRIVGSIDGDDTTVHDIEIPFKVGDSVKVIDGPFKDFDGLVQEINDRNRIKVNVNIFGRPTPIELNFNQIITDN